LPFSREKRLEDTTPLTTDIRFLDRFDDVS
jgi:hypothetical protein